MAMNDIGLWADLMNVDDFVRINNLPKCTDPIFIDRNVPTAGGVLSYQIFGTSQSDRRTRMAYIDLAPYHYMNPLAAQKLASYDRTLSKCLYSQGRYRLENGQLVEDYENGDSGPEFLYQIWGKVKVKDKDTVVTKEIQDFFEMDRSLLFITKLPVIPAFLRDLNTSGAGGGSNIRKSSNVLNSMYSSIIAYTQTLNTYTDTFTHMSRVSQSRVQTLICDIYSEMMINKVKGSPSKFGMLRRSMQGKNVSYAARLVISSPILRKDSFEDVQVKFGYAVVPLAYCLSCFFPFMVQRLKRFFDAMFIEGGKVPVIVDGKVAYQTYPGSYDENEITKMISRYLYSPNTRFDPVMTPPDASGVRHKLALTGRFHKSDTTISRPATVTDIMYIVAKQVVADKHVFVTRYPLDNYNGQFPVKIEISTTVKTMPATIGETFYQFFPVCEGDPSNAFVDTLQFSNTMLAMIGGDYDGDQVTLRPVYSKEANAECEARIKSPAYVLNIEGGFMRGITKDFALCCYNLTRVNSNDAGFLKDINAEPPKYPIKAK
ncbi:hypothetical protein [uncultured Duncaniella sp.]|uniref:hypothetical protein n=1 Tax=uncultured Duncaniella sp. TaxID=2768039 RepID=UPI0026106A7D|nr:hypothetical protein [uncultured Duncaniella sp.]